jgi:hypothetical protein
MSPFVHSYTSRLTLSLNSTRLGWIASDNVGVNDTLMRTFEMFIRVEGIGYWTEKTRRLRCIGHIFYLAT